MVADATFIFILIGWFISRGTAVPNLHPRPNIILIVADDLGYGDLASYGHPTQEWNILDDMATEGARFTQFYSPATFCTPSRAALLTGRLPVRLGMRGDYPVFLPSHSTGLPRSEITIAELLRDSSYNTGIVGKWHLGINQFNSTDGAHLPDKHGFQYVGTNLPFSLESVCDHTGRRRDQPRASRCFLYRQNTLVQQPISFHNLTSTMVQEAQAFLYNHYDTKGQGQSEGQGQIEGQGQSEGQGQPFFLYLSLLQPHTPMFNDPRFKGTSARGEYGDQIAEMAWAVEETMKAVHDIGQGDNTLVAFVSDHGPHREMCTEAGNTGPFRGGKGNFYEGGIRVPAFFWWPRHIQSNPANPTLASLTDMFATFADFAGSPLPIDIDMDSISLMGTLRKTKSGNIEEEKLGQSTNGEKVKKLHSGNGEQDMLQQPESEPFAGAHREALFFYCGHLLTAVRYARYKIHFRHQRLIEETTGYTHCIDGVSQSDFYEDYQCHNHKSLDPPVVYDIENDPGEWFPLVEGKRTTQVLEQVEALLKVHEEGLNIPDTQLFDKEYMSESLIPCCNWPYCICN